MTRAVISAWSAMSPLGLGADALRTGLADGRAGVVPADPDGRDRAGRTVPVPGFDIRERLGRRGTRSMDRVSALAVATVQDVLRSRGEQPGMPDGADVALVLGTSVGSVKSSMDITRDSLTRPRPHLIDAGRIPNAIMNSAAAQCAIWHDLRGPNTTVAGGLAAAVLALRYALRLLAAGRATAVLCGGAEELTPERIRLSRGGSSDRDAPDVALGEGCAMVLLERPGADVPALAELLAVSVRVHMGATWPETYAECLHEAMTTARIGPADLAVVAVSGRPERRAQECGALRAVLGEHPCRCWSLYDVWGDAGAATAALQLVALLAAPLGSGVAAVMAVDPDGTVGCVLLRAMR